MLGLGGERLTPKLLDHYLHLGQDMLQLLFWGRGGGGGAGGWLIFSYKKTQITAKSLAVVPFTTLDISIKFHCNPFITF